MPFFYLGDLDLQTHPRYPLKTPFLSLVTLTIDLDLQTCLRQRHKQNPTQFTACGKNNNHNNNFTAIIQVNLY